MYLISVIFRGIVNHFARQRKAWRALFIGFNAILYLGAIFIYFISFMSVPPGATLEELSAPTLAMKMFYGLVCFASALFISTFGILLYRPLGRLVRTARREGRDPNIHNKV